MKSVKRRVFMRTIVALMVLWSYVLVASEPTPGVSVNLDQQMASCGCKKK